MLVRCDGWGATCQPECFGLLAGRGHLDLIQVGKHCIERKAGGCSSGIALHCMGLKHSVFTHCVCVLVRTGLEYCDGSGCINLDEDYQ